MQQNSLPRVPMTTHESAGPGCQSLSLPLSHPGSFFLPLSLIGHPLFPPLTWLTHSKRRACGLGRSITNNQPVVCVWGVGVGGQSGKLPLLLPFLFVCVVYRIHDLHGNFLCHHLLPITVPMTCI